MLFNKTPTLKDIVFIGLTSIVIIVANMFTLRAGTLLNYGGMGLYYAALMLYRHFALLKHDGKNGPLEDADERARSIAHEAGYRTLRFVLSFVFVGTWTSTTHVMSASSFAVFIVGLSITIYTLLELDLRLE